jgi:hypothetical protein
VPFKIIGEFTEVQSGGDSGQTELAKALAMVRKSGGDLLVTKLDRSRRKVSFIATLA